MLRMASERKTELHAWQSQAIATGFLGRTVGTVFSRVQLQCVPARTDSGPARVPLADLESLRASFFPRTE